MSFPLNDGLSVFSLALSRHRGQKCLVPFTESRVTKLIPRGHELAVAATLVTAQESSFGVSSSFFPRWEKSKLLRQPAQDGTLVRRFVIHRKIQAVWLAQ